MTDGSDRIEEPRSFGELMHDFLLEYSRKFLLEVLRGAPAKAGERQREICTGREITLRWDEWCGRYASEMESVTAGMSDEKVRGIYEEVLGFMVFLALRMCGARGLPPAVAAEITANVPRSPFGAFEPGEIVTRYSRGGNPHVSFARAVCERLGWPESAQPRLILIASMIARFTDAVLQDAGRLSPADQDRRI